MNARTNISRRYLSNIARWSQRRQNPSGRQKRAETKATRKCSLRLTDWLLFNVLREWRAERCKEEGIPPYVIYTNLQLARDFFSFSYPLFILSLGSMNESF
ncbi:MAG: HRDC domain-containing protein [Proteobacteria bacterium]|nr:HRDC domain-containing protein [Pseudomonadota bacterium]